MLNNQDDRKFHPTPLITDTCLAGCSYYSYIWCDLMVVLLLTEGTFALLHLKTLGSTNVLIPLAVKTFK